ncbi:MAG: arginyltransferase [Proteobacteria bacterium]|jgi:arginine-tRNA-protein transferase|nr:arginyltransferase [Pseudomonadota bacterium]
MNDENRLYNTLHALRFFASLPHACSYLDDREATTLFVDPDAEVDMESYRILSQVGFRRSGTHIYRPHCGICRACVPVRLPVKRFRPNRSQRRCREINRDLTLIVRPAEFDADHFRLYRRYMQARHPGGSMDISDPAAYKRIMTASWSDTLLYEFRRDEDLLAVAVVDQCQDSLSAVYTYFNPEESRRGLGVFAILSQVEQACQSGREWVYLGYWNRESSKMAYKDRYQPLEYFDGLTWRETPPA